MGELPPRALIEATIFPLSPTRGCGLLLRCDPAMEHYYQIRWEPGRQRVVFDRWPRPGDQPFTLERPLQSAAGEPLRLKVFMDGSVIVVYMNDSVALNCRGYDHSGGQLGLFVSEAARPLTVFPYEACRADKTMPKSSLSISQTYRPGLVFQPSAHQQIQRGINTWFPLSDRLWGRRRGLWR